MKKIIPVKRKLSRAVKTVFNKFQKSGFEIYLVGGAVRDLLMKKKIHDCDFTTNAKPEEIQKLFPETFYDNIFGTVGIPLKKEIYEITTYRTEQGYTDRRHPNKVVWGNKLEEDLKRRDFTINTMVIGPRKDGKLELIDLFEGEKDLKKRLIRAVGNPKARFNEDSLRMMRAIRIASQLSFVIEEKTFKAIKENAEHILEISGERIRDELIRILKSDYPADGLMLLYNSGLLAQILPEVVKGKGVQQAGHHQDDVFTHNIKSLKFCKNPDPIIRLASLLHDVGKPVVVKKRNGKITFYNHEIIGASIARHIGQRLRFSKKDREKLVNLVRWHMFTVDEKITDSAVRRFIRRIGKENVNEMMDVRIADRLGGGCLNETSWRLRLLQKRILDVQKHIPAVEDLKISGHDVMKVLNLDPGPKVGQILNRLFEEISDNPIKNKKSYLLKRLKEFSQTTKRGTAIKVEE
ncbi:HD domain-containing protein [Candidatus Microgenomates bacterium]|nr:HD domain-containing protein [Candidatus Microgenomates bacterium]